MIVELNGDHTYVSGVNVKYVDLTASSAFGTNPVTGGYIQAIRLYGYPHPMVGSGSSTGKARIASATVSVLTGSGW